MTDYTKTQYGDNDEYTEIEYSDDSEQAEITDGDDTKQDNSKLTAIGMIRKAEKLISEGKEVPKDLHWTLPQIDVEALRPKPEANDREKIKAELRDELEFEQLQKELPEDLTDEQAAKMNEVIEKEIKLGKSKVEALNYAKYLVGIKDKQDTEQNEKGRMIGATSFPIITPRKRVEKKENLINTAQDKIFVEMLKSQGVTL